MALTPEEKAAAEAAKEAEKAAKAEAKAAAEAAKVDPRQERWEEFLTKHAKQNPAKHAQRLAAGELDKIPDSFN